MRSAVIAIFVITISALILFTSTDTITIFSGSHYLSDISNEGNDIKCTWCHSWVQNELNHSSVHTNFKCEECHRMTIATDGRVIKYAVHNASGIYPGNQSHAAYTPRCLDCHGGKGIYYNDSWAPKQALPAKAFNESDYGSDYSAHKSFVEYSARMELSSGENEACIACHTNYSMKFEYNYFWNISYSMSGWVINSFSYNGTRNYVVNYQKTGAKHEFLNKTEIECTKCHENIYEALVNGTSNPDNEDYLTHAPIEINHGTDLYAWDIKNCWGNYRYHSGYVINSNSGEFTLSQQCEETWERTTDDGITINFSLGVNSFIWTFDKSGTSSKSVELYFDNNTDDNVFYGVESDSYWCSDTLTDCYCIMSSPGDYSNCHPNPSEIGISIVKKSGHVEFHMSNSLNESGTVKMLGSHVFEWYDYTRADGDDPLPTAWVTPNGTVYVGSCYLPDENGW